MKIFNLIITLLFFLLLEACVDMGNKCKENQALVNGACVDKPIPTPSIAPTPVLTPSPVPTAITYKSCGTIPHNGTESRIAYSVNSVAYGQSCSSVSQNQTRTCTNGVWSAWSGSYTNLSCSVQAASACGNIASGAFELRTMYQAAAVSEGQTCVSEIQNRLCTNGQLGTWSGTYTQPKCVVSRVRFESTTAPTGGVCNSETQLLVCQAGVCGVWSPNRYTNVSCSSGASISGWTVFTPSADTRIMYVSTSGNDSTGQVYSKISAEVGTDPFKPEGAIRPFATYAAAFTHARAGYSDWILFKRGETLYQVIGSNVVSGRSNTEPFLVGSYGSSGLSPLLKIGAKSGVTITKANSKLGTLQYIAILGLRFYSHTRNPSDVEFVNNDGGHGLNMLAYGEGNAVKNILIEGCAFLYNKGNNAQGSYNGIMEDIKVRRSVFLHSYSHDSHAQGLYAHGVNRMLVEENVFDHNGWLVQQTTGSNTQTGGQATMFNHNTYFSGVKNVIMVNNVFLRPSSIQNKFTANDGVGSAGPITVQNNLYVDGEVVISLGGNVDGPLRFKDIKVLDNIITNINISRPTNRTLAWGISIQDWDGGLVKNNYILNTDHGNSYAIYNVGTSSRNVTISNNHVYNFKNLSNAFKISASKGIDATNMVFSNNKISLPSDYSYMINAEYATSGKWTFSGNQYFSEKLDSRSFNYNKVNVTFDNWKSQSGDNSVFAPISLPAVIPSIPGYMASIGETATIDAFVEKCRAQDRYNWDIRFTSDKVNTWIRAGFNSN